ncbi:MAG TPA: hypothetical protein VFT39_18140 [Vicinamibacterales bacterium]|nr:hypothetical protein [Vicinamibacterales bacterium]
MADLFTLSPFEFFVLRTRTRFPFRYGIASMTEVPHLFVRTRVLLSARAVWGLTAEGLPPKWFTKNPATTFDQDLPEMLASIVHAADIAQDVATRPVSFFDLWREVHRSQTAWADAHGLAPLVAELGVALVERAVLDGLCRVLSEPLHRVTAQNRLGLKLGEIYTDLEGCDPRTLLPESPLKSCFVRHTIGLGDALSSGELTAADRVNDGLPQDLETSIRAYGLRYFKIKLSGMPERDLPRLEDLARILDRETGGQYSVTVDGNENFISFDEFRDLWDRIATRAALKELCRRTIVVEQPVHRDRALLEETRDELSGWPDRPPLIIDESDGAIGDVPRALDLGYAGASYKNCKGIVKGLANACLLAARRRAGKPGVLTGEDLCNLGPIAVQQDLAMTAILGIDHVERNGHHYYRGLSMFSRDWQDAVLRTHHDLYTRHESGFPHLHIEEGRISLASLNRAPFGVEPQLDVTGFAPLERTQLARIS